MNIINQLCLLELSKKLYDILPEWHSFYYYMECAVTNQVTLVKGVPQFTYKLDDESIIKINGLSIPTLIFYPAFTFQELFNLLDDTYEFYIQREGLYFKPKSGTDNSYFFRDKNMANNLAKMIIAQHKEMELYK